MNVSGSGGFYSNTPCAAFGLISPGTKRTSVGTIGTMHDSGRLVLFASHGKDAANAGNTKMRMKTMPISNPLGTRKAAGVHIAVTPIGSINGVSVPRKKFILSNAKFATGALTGVRLNRRFRIAPALCFSGMIGASVVRVYNKYPVLLRKNGVLRARNTLSRLTGQRPHATVNCGSSKAGTVLLIISNHRAKMSINMPSGSLTTVVLGLKYARTLGFSNNNSSALCIGRLKIIGAPDRKDLETIGGKLFVAAPIARSGMVTRVHFTSCTGGIRHGDCCSPIVCNCGTRNILVSAGMGKVVLSYDTGLKGMRRGKDAMLYGNANARLLATSLSRLASAVLIAMRDSKAKVASVTSKSGSMGVCPGPVEAKRRTHVGFGKDTGVGVCGTAKRLMGDFGYRGDRSTTMALPARSLDPKFCVVSVSNRASGGVTGLLVRWFGRG